MSSTSMNFAAILLLLLVAVEFGGGSLLTMLTRRIPGYLDNPLRQNMFRAGHAHPGVWLVLGLVGMLYVDQTPLSGGLKTLVRVTLPSARDDLRNVLELSMAELSEGWDLSGDGTWHRRPSDATKAHMHLQESLLRRIIGKAG